MEGGIQQRKKARRTPTGAYSGKTKLDRWLEQMVREQTALALVIQPPAPYPYPSGNPDNCKFRVHVLEVDRYAVKVVFSDQVSEDDGAVWWVSKDSIRAAGLWVEADGFPKEEEDEF